MLWRRLPGDHMADSGCTPGLKTSACCRRRPAPRARRGRFNRLPGTDGIEFLAQAHTKYPAARSRSAEGHKYFFFMKIFRRSRRPERGDCLGPHRLLAGQRRKSPEELLYPRVQEALSEWTRINRPQHEVIRIRGRASRRPAPTSLMREPLAETPAAVLVLPGGVRSAGIPLMRDHSGRTRRNSPLSVLPPTWYGIALPVPARGGRGRGPWGCRPGLQLTPTTWPLSERGRQDSRWWSTGCSEGAAYPCYRARDTWSAGRIQLDGSVTTWVFRAGSMGAS